jgi:hypothetical protein
MHGWACTRIGGPSVCNGVFAERDLLLAVAVDVCGDLVRVVAQIDGWMGM